MSSVPHILITFGTRPETLKLLPVIRALQRVPHQKLTIVNSGQHDELVQKVIDEFDVHVDKSLHVMTPSQSLTELSAELLKRYQSLYEEYKPDIVIVQGDTTTAAMAALAAFYQKVKIAHVEAGLRSHDMTAPFPEEMNRRLISQIATYHFAPTPKAENQLRQEGITRNIFHVGNTIVDLILTIKDHPTLRQLQKSPLFNPIKFDKKIILFTCHRRENFGEPLHRILKAIQLILNAHEDVQVVCPIHLNPQVNTVISETMTHPRFIGVPPLSYQELMAILRKSTFVLTDSGGLQEEAPSMQKPLLVLRDVTERPEGIEAGIAKLVGSHTETIVSEATKLLSNPEAYKTMTATKNPYGDGQAAQKITSILLDT